MGPYLIWFLLFGLYLLVIPFGISPFETPKVVIFEIIIDLIILKKFLGFKRISARRLFTAQTILLGILLILSFDQILLFHPANSFFGNPFRLQGLFLFWHLLMFSFVSKNMKISKIPKIFYHLSFIFLIISTLILGVNQNGRAFGTLGEPNALAATALFIFPFAYFMSVKKIKVFIIPAAFLVIMLSGSRAGFLGFTAELVFIILTSFKISYLKSITAVVLLIIFSMILPIVEGGGWFENRSQIWQTAFYAGLKSPVLGQGFGNIQTPINETARNLNNPAQYAVIDSSHNFILDLWIQGGIVALIAIISLIFLSVHGLSKHKQTMEMTAFFGLITAMLFNPVSVVNLLAFWWILGQGFSDH